MINFQNENISITSLPQKDKNKSIYWLGLLGFIPMLGFFVGFGLVLAGLLKYKDKKLIIIGVFCILFTVFAYSFLYFGLEKFDTMKKGWADLSQIQINEVVKDIEFYKLQHGEYPDDLKQLLNQNDFVNIQDPIKGLKVQEKDIFIYKNLGNKYLLCSKGLDDILNTKDDIYPNLKNLHNVNWIKKPE